MWELNEYTDGELDKPLKSGAGRPQSLEIAKEIVEEKDFQELYIKPKDFFFDHYEGDIVSGKRQGNGILFNKDGSRFEGTWHRNKPKGIGAFVYADLKFDLGEYKSGHLCGKGRRQFFSGDIHRGQFYKGRMQGFGLYFARDKKEWVFGYFKNNSLDIELEKGHIEEHHRSLPDLATMEKKYKEAVESEQMLID